MQKNSGVSVAKHKHNKKQSGTLRKPFIKRKKEKGENHVHWELPVGSNEVVQSYIKKKLKKNMNNIKIRRRV